MKKILFISYFFDEIDGVGSLRSRSLVNFLSQKKCEITIIKNNNLNNKFHFLKEIFQKISNNKYDVVYITCGPFFHLLFVSLICNFKKLPLVVDIRDGWSLNIANRYGQAKYNYNKGMKYKISTFIEQIAYWASEKFVVCTQGMYYEYEKLFKESSKLLLIENGYDFEPVSLSVTNKVYESVKFVCIGKFAEYDYDKAKDILLMIKKINETKNVSITFIGSNVNVNAAIVKEIGLSCIVNFLDRMTYSEIRENIIPFDFGLLVIRDEDIDYGTKIFDYIGLSKPILFNKSKKTNFVSRFSQYLVDDGEILENRVKVDFIENRNTMRYAQFKQFKGLLY